jgi:hypothetical protein
MPLNFALVQSGLARSGSYRLSPAGELVPFVCCSQSRLPQPHDSTTSLHQLIHSAAYSYHTSQCSVSSIGNSKMSTEDETVIAPPLHDRAREVHVIRALYPQEFLNRSKKPLNSEAIAASPGFPGTYHNTGVQTLPPANGDVFRLVHDLHGRELSHNDYARSMGSAGVGRLSNDPRMNPYELIYGPAYDAPADVKNETCTNSGLQTASHDMRRKALDRAKSKHQ